jgi:ubiquinone/menaquinone biosynthesis C-methylase UbiE
MNRKTEIEQWFSADSAGNKWDGMYAEETPGPDEHTFRQRRDFAVSLVERRVRRGARLLDLGCGAGAATAELLQRGWSVAALDYSADMLAFARERLRGSDLDSRVLLRGDAGRLPFASGSFDCIICLGVISYQEDYSFALREIRRLLTVDGLALITFRNVFNPVVSDPWKAAKAIGRLVVRQQRPRDRGMGRFLDPLEVAREIEAAGLRRESFEGIGLGPFSVAGRSLFSDRTSVRLSRGLSRALQTVGLGWILRWSADVAMFVCRPNGVPLPPNAPS